MTILTPPDFGFVKADPDEPVSEMVERAAGAVGKAMYAHRNGSTLMAWSCSPERREAIKYVKAVLAAIREPSKAMNNVGEYKRVFEAACADVIYEAMIDEALR